MVRAAVRREEQREALIAAAERRIAAQGLAGLKARELAAEIGVATGAIYNLVADLDELVLRVASRTLHRLDEAIGEATAGPPAATPQRACERLTAIAVTYRRFATDNEHLWRMLFLHRMQGDRPVPDWAVSEQIRLFRHVLQPLAALMPAAAESERMAFAQTLFSAAHGVVSLGLDSKLVGVPAPALDRQLAELVRLVCRGLQTQDGA